MRASPAVATSLRQAGTGECGEECRRFLPWLVAVALFMETLDATIVNTAVPVMSAALHVQPLSLKGVLTSYTLALAVFLPVSGWMADRFGTLRVFASAIAIFTLGSLLCGLSLNVPMLVASRILQGLGGAMMTPVGRLALVRSFPRSELMAALNFVIIPALIGPLLGPAVGGFIVHFLPWRVIFLVNLPFGLAGLALVRRYMPDYRTPNTPPLDRTGFLLFGAGVGLLSYALEVFGEHRLPLRAVGTIGLIASVLIVAYVWHAHETPAPVLELRLLRTRTLRVSVLGGFITRLGFGGMPFLLPLLYQIGLGFPAWKAGLFTMPQALAAMGMKVAGRKLLAQFGHRCVLIANTVLLGLAIASFAFVGQETPVWCILLLGLVIGFFGSLQFTSINSLVYADVDDLQASKAGSIASTLQQMSLSFGVAIGALVTGYFLRGVDQTVAQETIAALHKAFLTMGGLTCVSALMFQTLQATDGNNVSNRAVRVVVAR